MVILPVVLLKMVKLNFGCGTDVRKGWVNVDIMPGADVRFDFNEFPYPLAIDRYDYVLLDNVLEHLLFPDRALEEIWKCCKKGAIIDIIVPHYTNRGAYNDMQHRGFFNERCFHRFAENKRLKVISVESTPTWVGKFFPRWIRDKLSFFINGLYSQIYVRYEVIK